jgi:AraC family transcriptional regulator of adaptative response/methylated-DNA-[protein]-cysteine methyltransferase
MIYSRTIETPIGPMLACSVKDGVCSLEFCDHPDLDREKKKLSED